ncbi:hypothetical protein ACKC6W_000673 [Vibrio vulnificus]|uniref:hypothetical protein n=1 Tax=Vibrio tubiashii TaxID=29498 RepID=UPI001EFEF00A|nr:hypothetical protein [Vibrio tubiashii]MCG9576511.1 hypothetical protein [Vibrio tubiashii]HCG7662216.1 hypothetical protein [Vibrio parahaemolyticus]
MKIQDLVKSILPSYDDPYVKQHNANTEFVPSSSSTENILHDLIWPMTSFHIISNILDTNDSYQRIVASLGDKCWDKSDHREAKGLGEGWAKYLNSKGKEPLPSEIHELLYNVFKQRRIPAPELELNVLLDEQEFMLSALKLLLASDHCSKHIKKQLSRKNNNLIELYVNRLRQQGDLATLSTGSINGGTVHHKTMTPQSGISLNSLTHSLAYVKPGIECYTLKGRKSQNKGMYNVLILPWPLKIRRSNFKIDEHPPLKMDDTKFGFFSYENKNQITPDMIVYGIRAAIKETGYPDLVVIPECAIDSEHSSLIKSQLEELLTKLEIPKPVLIYGAYKPSQPDEFGANYLELSYVDDFSGNYVYKDQPKHHRWALDRNQIINYKLGTILNPSKKWWENCTIDSRKILSYVDANIHICPLICEDLARQDPIAPVVRALGPSLVVALLLDGPQISARWPGKYASVLSEDPGSSVLSISPYGMTQRSTGGNFPPSSEVALWSDNFRTIPLELEDGCIGISLVLEKTVLDQWSADGGRSPKDIFKYAGHLSVGCSTELDKITTQKEEPVEKAELV